MFDPTIYENLKVVIEGGVYELDLQGDILITDRLDRIELATMSRDYALRFVLSESGDAQAEICLSAGAADLAAEILQKPLAEPGCRLSLRFTVSVKEPDRECAGIAAIVRDVWGEDCLITQKLTFAYGGQGVYTDVISIDFGRKFGEDVIGDLPPLLQHMVKTLNRLNERAE